MRRPANIVIDLHSSLPVVPVEGAVSGHTIVLHGNLAMLCQLLPFLMEQHRRPVVRRHELNNIPNVRTSGDMISGIGVGKVEESLGVLHISSDWLGVHVVKGQFEVGSGRFSGCDAEFVVHGKTVVPSATAIVEHGKWIVPQILLHFLEINGRQEACILSYSHHHVIRCHPFHVSRHFHTALIPTLDHPHVVGRPFLGLVGIER
mmetsp:Transcript_32711/g.96408  ORF Transcript_32711/g.96408 Transcript_32711/m.96408 type:complete len:204 (-) Transcript_32711:817-1428(-)